MNINELDDYIARCLRRIKADRGLTDEEYLFVCESIGGMTPDTLLEIVRRPDPPPGLTPRARRPRATTVPKPDPAPQGDRWTEAERRRVEADRAARNAILLAEQRLQEQRAANAAEFAPAPYKRSTPGLESYGSSPSEPKGE